MHRAWTFKELKLAFTRSYRIIRGIASRAYGFRARLVRRRRVETGATSCTRIEIAEPSAAMLLTCSGVSQRQVVSNEMRSGMLLNGISWCVLGTMARPPKALYFDDLCVDGPHCDWSLASAPTTPRIPLQSAVSRARELRGQGMAPRHACGWSATRRPRSRFFQEADQALEIHVLKDVIGNASSLIV